MHPKSQTLSEVHIFMGKTGKVDRSATTLEISFFVCYHKRYTKRQPTYKV